MRYAVYRRNDAYGGRSQMTLTDTQRFLFDNRDDEYAAFSRRLLPETAPERVIGVRVPVLRKYAKSLGGTPAAEPFMHELPHMYHEENQIHMFLINEEKDHAAALSQLEDFMPYIDNWAVCDNYGSRAFKKHPEEVLAHIRKWIAGGRTYTVRYGIGLLMADYLDASFDPEYIGIVTAVDSDEYYVNMMCGWYMATALAKQPAAAMPYFTDCLMNETVWKMAVRKSVESFRVPDETKKLLRTLRYGK
jgi:3-methyladenine DNA glycosylase AlkD